MAAVPSTVNVECPRCDVPIVCTLAMTSPKPKPGQKPEIVVSVPDLGDKFAEHYAEHHADAQTPSLLSRAIDEAMAAGVADGIEVRKALGLDRAYIGRPR